MVGMQALGVLLRNWERAAGIEQKFFGLAAHPAVAPAKDSVWYAAREGPGRTPSLVMASGIVLREFPELRGTAERLQNPGRLGERTRTDEQEIPNR